MLKSLAFQGGCGVQRKLAHTILKRYSVFVQKIIDFLDTIIEQIIKKSPPFLRSGRKTIILIKIIILIRVYGYYIILHYTTLHYITLHYIYIYIYIFIYLFIYIYIYIYIYI